MYVYIYTYRNFFPKIQGGHGPPGQRVAPSLTGTNSIDSWPA